MGNHNDKEDITVESLLRLKRSERPDGDFWNSFDNSFQQRRLSALVERESPGVVFLSPFLKFATVAFPVFLVAGLAFLWTQSQDSLVEPAAPAGTIASAELPTVSDRTPPAIEQVDVLPILAASEGQLSSQFVIDAIEDTSDSGLNFRKVLYTPAIHLSAPSGSFYVRDNLNTSRHYKVTTADVRLGRNF
jgi:hypothetical protein